MSSISHYLSSASTASSVTSAFSAPKEGIKDILKEIKACSTNILEPKLAADQKSSACASLQVLYEQLLETNQQENLFSNLPRGLSSQELSTYFFSKLEETNEYLIDVMIDMDPLEKLSRKLNIVPRNIDDSEDTYTIKKYLHDIQRLNSSLNDEAASGILSKKAYVDIVESMPLKLRNAICELIWMVDGRPEGDFDYGGNKLRESSSRLKNIKNIGGSSFLEQYLTRLQSALEISKNIDVLEKCKHSILEGNGVLHIDIPSDLKNQLKHSIWESERRLANQADNPNFGGLDFGDRKLQEDPKILTRATSLHDGKSILDHFIDENKAKLKDQPWDLEKIIRDPRRFDTRVTRLAKKAQDAAKPRIMMVGMELRGYQAIGGLAEALEGLTKGLQHDKYDVKVLLPYFRTQQNSNALEEVERTTSNYSIIHRKISGIDCYLIDPTKIEERFSIPANSTIYGRDDELAPKQRFARFSLYAADYCHTLYNTKKLDLIHIHDAHAALIAPILKKDERSSPPIVFTVHNNGYSAQVKYDGEQTSALKCAQLPTLTTNSLMEGVVWSDAVTTVSHTFGKESQYYEKKGKEVGHVFRKANAQDKFSTIVNGITTSNWDPANNQKLKELKLQYSSATPPTEIHQKKMECKQRLKELLETTINPATNKPLGTIDINKPLLFYVGRYDPSQKGIDKIPAIIEATLKAGGQFICIGLGHEGCPKEMAAIQAVCERYNNNGAILIKDYKNEQNQIHYQVALGFGPILRSAADIGVFPSIFEPCGLVQGETFVTGARVIATDCGGFSDTVITDGENKNGWLFKREDNWETDTQVEHIQKTIRQAINETKNTLYSGDTKKIEAYHTQTQKIMARGLTMSWNDPHEDVGGLSPIDQFGVVYQSAIHRAQQPKAAASREESWRFDINDPLVRGCK